MGVLYTVRLSARAHVFSLSAFLFGGLNGHFWRTGLLVSVLLTFCPLICWEDVGRPRHFFLTLVFGVVRVALCFVVFVRVARMFRVVIVFSRKSVYIEFLCLCTCLCH